jgi:hypothetical protein
MKVINCIIEIIYDYCNKQNTYLRDEVHASFAFLFLELQRDTSDRTLLDALHQVSDETSDFVSHSLGRNNSHLTGDTLVGVEVQGEP